MSVVFFGQFLIHEGEIDEPELEAALEATHAANLTIGELAVRAGYLSRVAVKLIQRTQREQPMRFGEIAEGLGFLTVEQTEQLLHQQSETHLYIGEALVQLGAIDDATLVKMLDRYKRQLGEPVEASSAGSDDVRVHPFVPRLLQQLPLIFLRSAQLQLRTEPGREWDNSNEYPYETSLACTGQHGVRIGLAASRELAVAIASRLLECPESELSENDVEDALGEFANWLLGSARAEVESLSSPHQTGLPMRGVLPSEGTAFELETTAGKGTLIIEIKFVEEE